MKPSLREVKEYFKNAKEVKSLENNFFFEIDYKSLNEKINKDCSSYWCLSKNGSWIMVWSDSQKKYAEIISYKEETLQIKKSILVVLAGNNSFSEEIIKKEFPELFEQPKQLTISEIEKILGYKIQLIKE